MLSYGQEANKYILLRDRIGNPIPGATLTISRNNTNILTNRTDLDGFAYLMINDFDYISIWFMGFDKPKLDSTVFKSDTTLIILDEARYQTPKLLIKKNEFQIDSSEYCSFIRDTIIEYHGDCSCEAGSGIDLEPYEYEKCDTLRYFCDCRLARPSDSGYFDLFKKIDKYFRSSSIKLNQKGDIVLKFNITKNGKFNLNEITGLPNEMKSGLIELLNFEWKSADMYRRPVSTNYIMNINIE